jgi:capsular exopolysaccharide synthesis family protein
LTTDLRAAAPPVDFRRGDPALDELGLDAAPATQERNLVVEAWHALRRRWLAALVVGLVLGSTSAVAVWYSVKNQYTSTAVLRVSMGQSTILEAGQVHDGATAFEVYKRTQRQLLRSPAVLTAALQRESVARLPNVSQLGSLAWLQNAVNVTFPDEAEIMQVSVTCDDQRTAETLADTIVEVYLQDIVYAEHQEKLNRINTLQKAETETEANLRKKRSGLRQLVDTLGTGDSEALTLAQKNTLQEYSILWTQLNQVEFDLKRAQRSRQVRDHVGPSNPVSMVPVTETEVETAALTDPIIAVAKVDLDRQQTRLDDARKTVFGAAEKEYVATYQASVERARQKIENRKASLRKDLALQKQNTALAADQLSAASVEVLQVQQKELAAKVSALRTEADKFGRSSVDAELMRAEIKALDELRGRIQKELEEANIEINTLKSRVVKLSSATTLPSDDHRRRMMLSTSFGGTGFCAGCALVVLWDLRRRRLNTMHEIADALRLAVLGTVPHVWRPQGSSSPHPAFEEAIDGIVARLVFAPADAHQVVLVTSAVAGEGKTTVAVNLATSFAGMGRKTVLVDFDLRRPMLHNIFDVDLAPGLGAVLAGQVELLDAVLSTPVENLYLLPAGAWGHRGLSGRNDELVKSIVAELREAYTNVVIDAGPVLPIVDTRVVARHTDGVVISLLRDVSEIPKVNSACELLRSFDIRILGAVMIGVPGEVYYAPTITPVIASTASERVS